MEQELLELGLCIRHGTGTVVSHILRVMSKVPIHIFDIHSPASFTALKGAFAPVRGLSVVSKSSEPTEGIGARVLMSSPSDPDSIFPRANESRGSFSLVCKEPSPSKFVACEQSARDGEM
jgi:hypothetical protein